MRALLFLVGMTVAVSAYGQRTILEDRFDTNANEWFIGASDDGLFSVEIEDGVYRLSLDSDQGFRYSSNLAEISNATNWSIVMKLRQTDGAEDNPYGIMFNAVDADNLYEFTVTSEKKARLQRYKEGTAEEIVGWTELDAINDQGEWNTLEVRKVNDAVACFINGSYAGGFTASYYKIFGPRIGIFLRWTQVVECDEIKVTTWGMDPIAVAQGADPSAKPVNLGSNINGTGVDFVDCLSADGSVLVYSRTGYEDNVGGTERSDIWISERNSKGEWSKARNLGAPLNNPSNNFAVSLTQDLNTLFVQGIYEDGFISTSGGVSRTRRTANGWSEPQAIPIKNYYNNSNTINSHISPDGTVLVSTIQRNDTRGNTDLYVSFLDESGEFSEPKNLGNVINTIGSETGPYIAADGKTMYFASDGHPGYEGRDIFVTTRLDDTWLNWSVPKNLGKPINTDEHDNFFQVPARGDSGYYSSTKNSYGSYDIYSIALPREAKPEAVFMVRGRVLDAETKKPIEGTVIYEALPEGTKVGTARSSAADGRYQVSLSKGRLYGVRADAEGYYALSETFDARELQNYTEADKDLYLSPIKKNVAIRLNNVFFDFGKYDLRPESFPELDRLADFLKTNASLQIEISGHTDNVGKDADNLKLSQERVNAVRSYVISRGIDGSRMTARGYGETKPIETNDTDAGRQMNRRVEFTILQ